MMKSSNEILNAAAIAALGALTAVAAALGFICTVVVLAVLLPVAMVKEAMEWSDVF